MSEDYRISELEENEKISDYYGHLAEEYERENLEKILAEKKVNKK